MEYGTLDEYHMLEYLNLVPRPRFTSQFAIKTPELEGEGPRKHQKTKTSYYPKTAEYTFTLKNRICSNIPHLKALNL